ncbi:MAG: type II toxin-antitoxin system PemK/MazF family toxin [Planctomycetota bacterium]
MTRGELWWAELAGDAGFRPVAIVSRAAGLERRRNVIIAEVTRVVRNLPSEVPLSEADGMPTACVVNTDNLHTIPKDRLRRRIAQLTTEKLFAVAQALRHSLDLKSPCENQRRAPYGKALPCRLRKAEPCDTAPHDLARPFRVVSSPSCPPVRCRRPCHCDQPSKAARHRCPPRPARPPLRAFAPPR